MDTVSFVRQDDPMKKSLLLLFILPLFGKLAAQHTCRGVVTDPNGKPLEYVAVLLTNVSDSLQYIGTATDAQGKFEFNGISYPSYFITASVIGYTNTSTATILQENKDTIKIIMTESTNTLNEYTFQTKVNRIEMEPGKIIMNVENSNLTAGNN